MKEEKRRKFKNIGQVLEDKVKNRRKLKTVGLGIYGISRKIEKN